MMNFINRQFPLLSWIMKAREARFSAKGFFAALSQTRKNHLIARELNLQVATDAENQPDIAALQFQLGRTKNVQFLPLNKDVDNIPLAENEVLFVPVSFMANKYITFITININFKKCYKKSYQLRLTTTTKATK